MKQYPFETVAYTADPAVHLMPTANGKDQYVEFVLDLETVTFAKNPLTVDFNHNTNEVIGFCAMKLENNEIVGKGAFCSHSEDDRAAQIADLGDAIPYGISPTLSFDHAILEEVPAGQTGYANGREYPGPVNIYREAEILSISVCSIPTNFQTSMEPVPLGRSKVVCLYKLAAKGTFKMSNETETGKNETPVEEQNVEQLGDETGVQDEAQSVRDPELQSFIDEFGLEKGVQFFQRSLSLDEAKMEDYAELKRLSKLSAEGTADDEEQKKEKAETTEGLAKLSAEMQKLGAAMQGLVARLNRPTTKLGATNPPKQRIEEVKAKPSYTASVIAALTK